MKINQLFAIKKKQLKKLLVFEEILLMGDELKGDLK